MTYIAIRKLGAVALSGILFSACGGGGSSSGTASTSSSISSTSTSAPAYLAASTPTPTPAPSSATSGITVLAGSGVAAFVDGSGTNASFSTPIAIALDQAGNLYVNDDPEPQANSTFLPVMRKVTPTGTVTTLIGFDMVYPFAIDGQGNFFGLGSTTGSGEELLEFSAAAQPTVLVSNANLQTGSSDGPLASATFDAPIIVAVDAAGNLYVADITNCGVIRKITPSSTVVTLAGSSSNCGHTDGVGTAASFSNIEGMAVDQSGNVYVSDVSGVNTGSGDTAAFTPTAAAIRKIAADGAVTTLAGSASAVGNADGTGSAATFYLPHYITTDNAGNVYVTDSTSPNNSGGSLIRAVSAAGVVTTIVGQANATTAAVTGPLPGAFPGIAINGIVWAGNGVIYALVQNKVLKIQLP